MIGTDPNISLPSSSDTYSVAIAKIATALEALADSITEKATPSALNINAPIDLQGNALTNVTALTLAGGNTPSAVGSIYFFGGEFYAIDAAGAVQLTANGVVNSSPGSITGLSAPAAVTYDLPSQEFRFTVDNTPTWADLVCDDLVLKGAGTGSIRFDVDSAITTARQIILKSLPASGKSLLLYDAATSTIEDNNATRATNAIKGTNLDITGNIIHPDRIQSLPVSGGATGGTASANTDLYKITITVNGTHIWRQQIPIEVGQRLKSVTFLYKKNEPNLTTFRIRRVTEAQVVAGSTGSDMASSTTSAANTTTATVTISSPVAAVTNEQWYVEIEHTFESVGSYIALPRFVYDQIA